MSHRECLSSLASTTMLVSTGRQELRVAANRASIGALDQKLSRPGVGVSGGRIDSEPVLQPILHQLPHSLMREYPEEADELGDAAGRGEKGAIGLTMKKDRREKRSCAMSSCVGLLPATDDYLGSNPSMVHHCRMSWASATQSGHVPSARTCSTTKFLQLELVA
ncbi:hypothetical protein PIB30_038335 [Stylosanthes scabra]|uniref:Uncharacterized protein n=1 Tax=Stylosanthes scabra TaxID=79078 RepID=A0ABU6WC43_9FABA|nr:hypothetical protein [Stylosanthes scabra]